jgi:hypothetical protein
MMIPSRFVVIVFSSDEGYRPGMDHSAGHELRRRIWFLLLLLPQCREAPRSDGQAARKAQARASASAEPARVRRPAPVGAFDCRELRPVPKTEGALVPETVELTPPGSGKTVFFSNTGEHVSFDRQDFLKAAECLKLPEAVRYLEEETGQAAESPILDAFQLSYVAAAMLDAGRAGVRLVEESGFRKSILRDGWASDGCQGRCRAFGRMYRLSADDRVAFLKVADTPKD